MGLMILIAFNAAIAIDLTAARTRALMAAAVGLISLIIGALALARGGRDRGRTGAIVGLALGMIGVVVSVIHLAGSTGFGTGGGRAGAIVALVLALIGLSLSGLALKRR